MDNRFQLDLTAMLHRLPRVYIELLIVSTHSRRLGSRDAAVATSHVQQLEAQLLHSNDSVHTRAEVQTPKFPALYLLSARGV